MANNLRQQGSLGPGLVTEMPLNALNSTELLSPYLCRTLDGFSERNGAAKSLIILAPRAGFEPATNRLTAGHRFPEIFGR
jgi:hypothetical protein